MNEQELSTLLEQLRRESAAEQPAAHAKTAPSDAAAVSVPPDAADEDALDEDSADEDTADEDTADAEALDEDVPDGNVPDDIRIDRNDSVSVPEVRISEMRRADTERPASRRTFRDAAVGAVMTVLAIIGLITSAAKLAQWVSTRSNLRQKQLKQAVTDTVLPFVIIDQPDFDSPEMLTDAQFLTASIWCMITDGRISHYPENLGMHMVPCSDITAAGNLRFGSARTPEYQTVSFNGDVRFYFDKEQGCYLVPSDLKLFSYEPVIAELHEAGNTVTAEVRYQAEQPAWQTPQEEIVKTVDYTLVKNGETWQVCSVKQIS